MTTAKSVRIEVVTACCGKCGCQLESESGSQLIDVANETTKGTAIRCPGCGEQNVLPARVYSESK